MAKLGLNETLSILADKIKPIEIFPVNSPGSYYTVGAENDFFDARPLNAYLESKEQVGLIASTESVKFKHGSECDFNGIDKLRLGKHMMDQIDGRWQKLSKYDDELLESVEELQKAFDKTKGIKGKFDRRNMAEDYVAKLRKTQELSDKFKGLITQKAYVGNKAYVDISVDTDGFKNTFEGAGPSWKPVPIPEWYLTSKLTASLPNKIKEHPLITGISENLDYVSISVPSENPDIIATIRSDGNPRTPSYEFQVKRTGVDKKNLNSLLKAVLV
ncbi:MAG: hypothetical protein V1678_02315 [Candidatus Aenigmatarchaeota archaeon]